LRRDYDNDGWEDLFVTDYGKNRLYHNDHGVFTEVAETRGSRIRESLGYRLCVIDFNRDGHLDLFVAIMWILIFPRPWHRVRGHLHLEGSAGHVRTAWTARSKTSFMKTEVMAPSGMSRRGPH